MSLKDHLQRFIFEHASVRGEYIYLHDSFQTIINQHAYSPSIQQLLGEALCVAGLLSAIIKFNGRLTVQFRGSGKLKLLLAQCDNHFNLRGLAKSEGELSYEDLMTSFSQGVLMIMLDTDGKGRYQGIVSWQGNSLAESIEGYFRESEQLATRIWLSVNEQIATGFLLQVIPASDKTLSSLEKEAIDPHWNHIIKLTKTLEPKDLRLHDLKTLLHRLYPEEEIRLFPPNLVKFYCTCTRKRGEDAILLLGWEQTDAELKDKHSIVVTCDFCNKEYVFDRDDVIKIFKNIDDSSSGTLLH